MVRTFVESVSIFVVSIAILAVIYVVPLVNSGKAVGLGWVHWKGFVLVGVGALYLVFGLILTLFPH